MTANHPAPRYRQVGPRPAEPVEPGLLGTMSDVDLGSRWGMHPKTITRMRQRLGVPPFHVERSHGRAEGPGVHPRLVGADLTRPARDLCAEYGVKEYAVTQARKAMGLNMRGKNQPGVPPRKVARADLTEKVRALLGTMSDRDVGEACGCSAEAVRARRLALGVPSFRQARPKSTAPVLRVRDILRDTGEEPPPGTKVCVEMIAPVVEMAPDDDAELPAWARAQARKGVSLTTIARIVDLPTATVRAWLR